MYYTIDKPKLVKKYDNPEENSFTGFVKSRCGDIACYENSKFHRTDGPAIIYANDDKVWCIHGKTHREDGPAVEFSYIKQWWYNSKCYGKDDDFTVDSWIKKWKLEIFK